LVWGGLEEFFSFGACCGGGWVLRFRVWGGVGALVPLLLECVLCFCNLLKQWGVKIS